MTNETF